MYRLLWIIVGMLATGPCLLAFSRIRALIIRPSKTNESQPAEPISAHQALTVEFAPEETTVQLVTPKSPLVIAIDDITSRLLDEAAYRRLSQEVEAITKQMLANACHISMRESGSFPLTVTEAHIEKATSVTLQDWAVARYRESKFKNRLRDLFLAFFAAAVGMVIDDVLVRARTPQTVAVGIATTILILSGLAFYFQNE
jgi:hypothetical protein